MLHDPNEETLFPALPPDALELLKQHGTILDFADGDRVMAEGTVDYPFQAVLEGKVRVTKRIGQEEQVLAVQGPGSFIGEISMLTGTPAIASAYSVGPSRILTLPIARLRTAFGDREDLRKKVVGAMTRRSQEVSSFLVQQEKLAALGKLSAGLAHELNNPAAAARRATQGLKDALTEVQSQSLLYDCRFNQEQRSRLLEVQQPLSNCQRVVESLDSIDRSDREDEMADWLDRKGVGDGWKLAPTLVEAGLGLPTLVELGSILDDTGLNAAVVWLESTLRMAELACELEASMTRISELVGAMKEYSYMDQAAFQSVDIHHGLDSTLRIFSPAFKKGIEVVRDYDRSLPPVCAYVGELNQVWTNLVSNAVDAMSGQGRLTVRTARAETGVMVEVCDTGSGIAPEFQNRIFEPFFTTKGVGKGTGLGLDISYRIITARHHGSIRVRSEPGNTRFQVFLPITQPKEEK